MICSAGLDLAGAWLVNGRLSYATRRAATRAKLDTGEELTPLLDAAR